MIASQSAIEDAEQALLYVQQAYVRRFGWKITCNTPGAYWLWQRDFKDEDAKALKWWTDTCERKPPLGNPSMPTPIGVMTVPLDYAVSMTRKVLDDSEVEE